VDIRADLYSLGGTLYYLLAGRPPFGGPEYRSARQKKKAHAEKPVPSLHHWRSDVPEKLEAVIVRLLAKDPADRFASPAEVADALEPFTAVWEQPRMRETPPAAEDVAASSTDMNGPATVPPLQRKGGHSPRTRFVVALALAAALLLLLVAAWKFELLATKTSPRDDSSEVPAAVPSAPDGDRPLIRTMQLRLFRGDKRAIDQGEIGGTVSASRFEDLVLVQIEFSEPVYYYLIAFNPDGKEQPCYPDPSRPGFPAGPVMRLEYPPPRPETEKQLYFPLNDGMGLQVFVVLAARTPLPSYEEWKANHGAAPWQSVQEDGVWRYDGRRLKLLSLERGQPQERDGAPRALADLCAFFQVRADRSALQLVAFPVKPKN
jgi:hypothetical protein